MSAAVSFPAFAGLVDFRNPQFLRERCQALLTSSDVQIRTHGPFALGWVGGGRSWSAKGSGLQSASTETLAIVGDFRLDNRGAIASELSAESGLSDCELTLFAWLRWGPKSLEKLRGEYTFAVWSINRARLDLVRGPYSATQMFFRTAPGQLAFASVAQPLANLPGTEKALNLDSVARFIGGVPQPGRSTFFTHVSRLEHSHVLQFNRETFDLRGFWRPERSEIRRGTDQSIADEFRDVFDKTVKANIARGRGLVAAHLSAGRDSGAIVATAARILAQSGEPLLALTSAPRRGFAGSGLAGKLDDESSIAAETARIYPNVQHLVVRPSGNPFACVSEAHALTPNPLADLPNAQWASAILTQAAAAGTTVMLGGDVGNFTVSGGGESHLSLVLREQGLLHWLERARAVVTRPVDLLKVLNWTFGGRIPRWAHLQIRRLMGLPMPSLQSLRLLREPFRSNIATLVESEIGDHRPPVHPFDFRAEMLAGHDPGNFARRALWGIDGRDPTADRDLVEFCFSVPAHMLVGPNGARPLYEIAFRDSLDPRQLRPLLRGYQAADWDLTFTPQVVAARFNESREHPYVRKIIDLDYVDRMFAGWPAQWANPGQMLHYRNDLLGAVAVADYIAVNF